MKNMKKAVSFLLVFAMVFTMNFATVFAAEANDNTSESTEASAATTNDDEGIMPLVYDQFSVDLPANSSTTLSGYTIPERYMAFEATATVMGGGTNDGSFSVSVLRNTSPIAGVSAKVDGVMHKKDWIDFQRTNNTCGFKLVNSSSVSITITVVYYSWS